MSDTEAADPAPAEEITPAPEPASPPKKKKAAKVKSKKPSVHPKWKSMCLDAINALKEKKGSSRQAILKWCLANYPGIDKMTANSHLKMTLKAQVKNCTLKQSKGTGASGSFKLGDKAKDEKQKKTKKAATTKKPKVEKKAAKPKARKPKAEKKAKASPKKTKAKKATKKPKAKAAAKKTARPKVKKGKTSKK